MSSAGNPACSVRRSERASADLDLALDGVGLSPLVEGHHDDPRAVAADRLGVLEERLFSLFQRDRVDDALALEAPEPRLEDPPPGAVDHDRESRCLGLGGEQVEEARHRPLAVEQVGVHVDVERVRAAPDLLDRDFDRCLEIVRLDERAEPRGARHVRPLADHHETRVGADLERLEPAPARPRDALRDRPRRHPLDGSRDLPDMLRRRAATPSDDVDEAVLRKAAEIPARVARLFVVLAHRVRQAGVRVAGHVRVGDARELLEERAHLARAQRAVDADDERPSVLDGDPERFGRLAR